MSRVVHQIYHNAEWKKFLDSLANDYDRRIAGATMDWIKTRYNPIIQKHYEIINQIIKSQQELTRTLNGELVWESDQGKMEG